MGEQGNLDGWASRRSSFKTTLLVNYPSGAAGTFADTLRAEASHQLADALVHGGFIITLCALMVCFTIWSRMLGSQRVAVLIGMVSFCVGCGTLIASMILDGFVTPALAARFVGTSFLLSLYWPCS
jgi:acyl-coenzyme A thioesterase PaaI-like protein